MFKWGFVCLWGYRFPFPIWVSKPNVKINRTVKQEHEDQLRANNTSVVFFVMSIAILTIIFLLNGWSVP
jgi:hypothetical protein